MSYKIGWAYLAGVIDSDGAIMITHQTVGHRGRLLVAITNIHKEYLEELKAFTKTGWLAHHSPNGYQEIYRLNWDNKQAEDILRKVAPHLVLKKPQADIALKYRKTFDYSRENKDGIRDFFRNKIRALNTRKGACYSL